MNGADLMVVPLDDRYPFPTQKCMGAVRNQPGSVPPVLIITIRLHHSYHP